MNILNMTYDNPHKFRIFNMINHIELLFKISHSQFPNEKIRWLDVACGSGYIANNVNIEKISSTLDFEVVGVELNQELVDSANKEKKKNRSFYSESAFKLPEYISQSGFHIVTAFEFLEHVDDPIKMLSMLKSLSKGYVMVGSPLNEEISYLPCQAHTYSFTKEGFENLFIQSGLSTTYMMQTHIGQYVGGHNWLTGIGSVNDELKMTTSKYPCS